MNLRVTMAAVVSVGLVLAGCGNSDEDQARSAGDAGSAERTEPAPEATEDSEADPDTTEVLVVEPEQPPSRPAETAAPSDAGETVPASTTTTDASTTSTPSTAAQSTTTTTPTTAPPTTAAPTTAPPTTVPSPTNSPPEMAVLETRLELLRLAGLDTYDGGRFSPDWYSTRNIVLWFWGAH